MLAVNTDYSPSLGRFTSEDPIKSGLNWYSYANNNPINFIDPDGLDAYIFHLPEFTSGAKSDRKKMMKSLGLSRSQVHLIPVDSPTDFKNGWNEMGTWKGKAVSIDAVGIYLHGNPLSLGEGTVDGWFFGTSMIDALEEKHVLEGGLILYGCNAGNIDYKDSNIAHAFAGKTQGAPVLAADGTVRIKVKNIFGERTYTPLANDTFRYWINQADPESKRFNQGWTIYRKEGNGETYVSGGQNKELTISDMLEINKENYVSMYIISKKMKILA